jgi:hypothetical protein
MKVEQEQEKHRHHKQPQFYLKGFAAKSSNPYQKTPDIWVYKKGETYVAGKNPSFDSVKDTGYGKDEDFYAFEEEDGTTNYNKYENLLENEFERNAKSILEKLRINKIPRELEELTENDKWNLSKYVCSMKIRGNAGKKIFFDAQIFERLELKQSLYIQGKSESEVLRSLTELVIIHEEERKSERSKIRMVEIARKFTKSVFDLNWQFLLAPDGNEFMTSDNPVVWENITTPQSWIIFPISSKVCLLCTFEPYPKHNNWMEEKKGFWKIDDEAFEGICETIVKNAFFEVYFSKKQESLVKFVNDRLN